MGLTCPNKFLGCPIAHPGKRVSYEFSYNYFRNCSIHSPEDLWPSGMEVMPLQSLIDSLERLVVHILASTIHHMRRL